MNKQNSTKSTPQLDSPNGNFHHLLKQLRKNSGYKSTIAFAEEINVHKNTQSKYEKSGDPKVDYLVSFSYLTKVTFWQLIAQRVLMGNAPLVHKQSILNEIGPLYGQIKDNPMTDLNSPTVLSFIHSLKNSDADNLFPGSEDFANNNNTNEIIAACQTLLNHHVNHPAVSVFKQSGNAMSPTINEGDTLFINSQIKKLSDGDLFLLTFGQMHTIKRIQLLPYGGILLISDNSQYQPISLSGDDITKLQIQGKLISTISHYG